METVQLGNSDLHVSPIILGSWALGGSNWGQYDKIAAIATIDKALDLGITTIDTAPAYNNGQAESLIGSVINKNREQYVIATKCGLNFKKKPINDLSPEFIEQDLHNSLKRLGTDYIDLYQCHWPDKQTPIQKSMEALVSLQDQGKIRQIGLSNFEKEDIAVAMQYANIVSMQPQYSLLDRTIEKELLPFCLSHTIGVITYGSLGAGLLSGKYSEPPKFSGSDARSFFYKFFKPEHWPWVNSITDKLKEIAEHHNVKPATIALAWNLAQQGVRAVIVGAKTVNQLQENAASINVRLNDQQLNELNILSEPKQ